MRAAICTQAGWGLTVYEKLAAETVHTWEVVAQDYGLSKAIERGAQYLFFVNWSSRVQADILANCECVNFHCTPLPFGRGGHPIENMLLRGFVETIITAHRMTEIIDGGPIYACSVPISLAGNKDDILDRFIVPCAKMIEAIVTLRPQPVEQQGEVVRFQRLTSEAYADFWAARP